MARELRFGAEAPEKITGSPVITSDALAVGRFVEHLQQVARPVSAEEDFARVAASGMSVDVVEGSGFDHGYLSPYLVTNPASQFGRAAQVRVTAQRTAIIDGGGSPGEVEYQPSPDSGTPQSLGLGPSIG